MSTPSSPSNGDYFNLDWSIDIDPNWQHDQELLGVSDDDETPRIEVDFSSLDKNTTASLPPVCECGGLKLNLPHATWCPCYG